MTKFFLAVHVIAAILAVGPVAVAASMFPPAARRAASTSDLAVVRALHRICRVYALVGISVPVFGFATAGSLGVTGDPWLVTSIVLTALAAVVLVVFVLPLQRAFLAETATSALGGLAMHTGVFNLLWAVVTVLMIVRPGSTTSA